MTEDEMIAQTLRLKRAIEAVDAHMTLGTQVADPEATLQKNAECLARIEAAAAKMTPEMRAVLEPALALARESLRKIRSMAWSSKPGSA